MTFRTQRIFAKRVQGRLGAAAPVSVSLLREANAQSHILFYCISFIHQYNLTAVPFGMK